MYNPTEISVIIKTAAQSKKIAIMQLLDDCRINKGFIYDLEHKSAYPSSDKISRIADCSECSVNYLLGLTDEAGNSTPSDRQIKQLDLSGNELTIVKLFEKLSETQQGELIVMAKLMAEQNDENYMQDGTA